jgi:hypothetical protein
MHIRRYKHICGKPNAIDDTHSALGLYFGPGLDKKFHTVIASIQSGNHECRVAGLALEKENAWLDE